MLLIWNGRLENIFVIYRSGGRKASSVSPPKVQGLRCEKYHRNHKAEAAGVNCDCKRDQRESDESSNNSGNENLLPLK